MAITLSLAKIVGLLFGTLVILTGVVLLATNKHLYNYDPGTCANNLIGKIKSVRNSKLSSTEITTETTIEAFPETKISTTPELTNKTFVFMILSCKHKPQYNFENSDRKDVIWYTFCEEYPDYNKTKLTMFYKTGTIWSKSRNFMLEYAMENMPSSRSYEYFVFLDGDILDQMVDFSKKIEQFQDWLLIEKPAIGYMRGSSIWTAAYPKMGKPNLDPNIAAHHKSTLGLIMPLNTEEWLTKRSWDYATWINNILSAMIYPTERIGFLDVSWNYTKASHTTNKDYGREVLWYYPVMYLNAAILPDADIRPSIEYLHEGVPDNKETAMVPRNLHYGSLCDRGQPIAKACVNRKVLLNGPPTVDWILANFDENHGFTKQLLEFHETHKDYLEFMRTEEFKPRLLYPTNKVVAMEAEK